MQITRPLVSALVLLITFLVAAPGLQAKGVFNDENLKWSFYHDLNQMQYGTGKPDRAGGTDGNDSQAPMHHQGFMGRSEAVKPLQGETLDDMGFMNNQGQGNGNPGGTSHAPTIPPAQPQGQQFDPQKAEGGDKVDYNNGGAPPDGPCFGPGSTGGANHYYNVENQLDGRVPYPPYRVLKPAPAQMKITNIIQSQMAGEFTKMLKNTTNDPGNMGEKTLIQAAKQKMQDDMKSEAGGSSKNAQSAMEGAAEAASEAMADEFEPTWTQMLDLSATPLINVGNEAAGSACSASQPIKTHANAVYLVQQAYHHIYLPIAILLLLPGAVATQFKGVVTAGVLNNSNDEDAVSPFTGILRSLIAIFLIPASQMIVSYSIDVGNSCQFEIASNINYGNIDAWADEQVFRAPPDSFQGEIMPPSALKVLGKLSGGSEKDAKVLNMDPASIMLQMLANSTAEAAAFGLIILCAFQIVMACYLLLMGPVAAAFFAWPSGVGSLFSRVFSSWVDAMINLALWRFWWCVVLLVVDTRMSWLQATGELDIYSLWELLMFISFLVIMTYVPFNPFDFKPGEMVQKIMDKSEEAVQEAANKKAGG